MRLVMRLKIIIGIKCLSMIYRFGVRSISMIEFERIISSFVTGIVGEMDDAQKSAYIWTHKRFDIGYNGDRIVDVNLTSEAKVQLQPNSKLTFTYEVIWKPSTIPYAKRFDKYLDPGFFQHKVR